MIIRLMAHFRFSSFRILLLSFMMAAGIFLFSGCSSTLKKQSVLDLQENRLCVEPLSGGIDTGYSVLPAFTDEVPLQHMLQQAIEYAEVSEFNRTDSLCRVVYSRVTGAGDLDSTFSPDRYINEVIAIYAELMPDTFPIPEEIATQVFQLQLVGSLDSLQFTPKDSAFVAGVFDRSQKTAYDVPVVWNTRVQRALFYYLTRNKATVERWRERSVFYLPFMKKNVCRQWTSSGSCLLAAY